MGNSSSSMPGAARDQQDPASNPNTAATSEEKNNSATTSTTSSRPPATHNHSVNNGNVNVAVDRGRKRHELTPGEGMNFDWAKEYIVNHRTPIATVGASISSTLCAYPLDFVKSRMQSYNTKFFPTVREALKHEGIRGMYKGCVTPIYTIAFVRAVSFTTYSKVKHLYDDVYKHNFGISPIAMANARGQYPNIHTFGCFFTAGCAAGAVIPFFAAPFELLKLKSQLAGKMARDNPNKSTAHIKTGTWRPAADMVRERGFFSLWKGFRLHLARDTLGTAVYFSVYEVVKQTLANAQGHNPNHTNASMWAGGLCGIFSWIIIYPIDVKKTQYQKRYLSNESVVATSKAKLQYFSAAGYRGVFVSLFRSGILNAMFFPFFEALKTGVDQLNPKKLIDDTDDEEDD